MNAISYKVRRTTNEYLKVIRQEQLTSAEIVENVPEGRAIPVDEVGLLERVERHRDRPVEETGETRAGEPGADKASI
jgi:hypothetical protein